MSFACVGLLGLAGVWLLSEAVLGGRILAPGDLLYFAVPPFTAARPPGLLRAANPTLTDLVFVVEPYLLHAREAIRGGALPIWDPHVGTGRPLGAEAAGQLFPTSWLAYVLPFWRSLGFVALAKLLLTAGGTFLFARSLRLRPVAAGLAAGSFAFGTQYVVWLGHPMTDVVGLMPWMFLFAERLGARGRAADAACLGLTIGLGLFGGHPESLLVAVSGTGAYFAARVARDPEPAGRRIRLALGSVVLAGAVGGLAWVPLVELVGQSTRAGRTGGADSVHQLLVGLVFPEWWGRPDKRVFDAGAATGLSSVFLGRAYLGVVPVLLWVGMLAVPRRPAQRFFAGAGLAALALMVDVPGLRWLATHVPPLSLMVLHYWIWLAVFSGAMLAGLGLDQLIGAPRERQVRALRLMGAAAAVPVGVAVVLDGRTLAGAWRGALHQLPVGQLDPGSAGVAGAGALVRWTLIAGLVLVAGAVGLRFARLRAGVGAFVLVLALADVVTIGRGYQPALPSALAHPPPPAALGLARPDTRLGAPDFVLAPNLAELYGRADVRVEDLPEIARYSRVFTALGGSVLRAFGDSVIPADRGLGEAGPAAPSRRTLVDLLGAGQILDAGGREPGGSGLRVAYRGPGERLIDNSHALPRAFGAYAWEAAGSLDAAVAALGGRSAAELARRPVIEGAPAGGGAPPSGGPVAARIVASSDTAVTVAVRMARPGYVVLGDLYYPGWSARVDGRGARILAADGLFRAVATGAGSHVVRFVYRPASVWVGGVLSLVGILTAAGVIVVSRRGDTPGVKAGA
ncbi:MAG: hypothetical protein QOE44_1285 [Solirubrobacteraceae bacterium]|nr:hypothetical protein [Solirubrobacteraceae bacterium]